MIDWSHIVDRTRRGYQIQMWNNIEPFKNDMLVSYRRDIWQNQSVYFEVWFEKMALYDIFSDILGEFGILLQPISGFSSLTIIHEAVAKRFTKYLNLNRECYILYFGDHDPSGISIDQAIQNELREKHITDLIGDKIINFYRVGLKYDDIEKYNLPPNIKRSENKGI